MGNSLLGVYIVSLMGHESYCSITQRIDIFWLEVDKPKNLLLYFNNIVIFLHDLYFLVVQEF